MAFWVVQGETTLDMQAAISLVQENLIDCDWQLKKVLDITSLR